MCDVGSCYDNVRYELQSSRNLATVSWYVFGVLYYTHMMYVACTTWSTPYTFSAGCLGNVPTLLTWYTKDWLVSLFSTLMCCRGFQECQHQQSTKQPYPAFNHSVISTTD